MEQEEGFPISADLMDDSGAFGRSYSLPLPVKYKRAKSFLVQGIKPVSWWESKKATLYAVTLWTLMLVMLITAIVLSKNIN